MTKFRTASITVVVTALILMSGQTFEAKKKEILDSLALSVVNSLVEIDTSGGGQSGQPESASAKILVAESPESAPVLREHDGVATLVLPLPPLKPLPKPLTCPASNPIQLATYRPDAVRQRFDFFKAPEFHTEIRVVTSDSVQTGDWAKLIASCREKSLKVCIEKSKNRQRVVILDEQTQEAEQPAG